MTPTQLVTLFMIMLCNFIIVGALIPIGHFIQQLLEQIKQLRIELRKYHNEN